MNHVKNLIHMPCICPYTGKNIGIAFLDTGIFFHRDFTDPGSRIVAFKDFLYGRQNPYDDNGHGTHICGIAAGNGAASSGRYKGIAPGARLIVGKVLDKSGSGTVSSVCHGIMWVIENKLRYDIRILNISIGTKVTSEYGEDSLLVRSVDAAWDAGLVVVAAAGNNGPKPMSITAPGISRKVITVGTYDDYGPVYIHGKKVSSYSGRGPTKNLVLKPDIVAPGSDITACAAKRTFGQYGYEKRSGTSMSTPVISGAAALLLEKYPALDNNTIKNRLCGACDDLGFAHSRQGCGLINIARLLEL